jgi:putative autotransporter adhesin-like protein
MHRHRPNGVWTGPAAPRSTSPCRPRFVSAAARVAISSCADRWIRSPTSIFTYGRLTLNCRLTANARPVEVTLPGQAFRRISVSGSAKLDMENLDQHKLALSISGSGALRTQGTVERLSVTIAGSGNAKLADVAVRRLNVKISGSGSVEAAPREEADITISGSGNVRLLSHPARLKTRVAGSGQIIQASLEAAEGKK